ncbi:hypothetical protein [Streptomyces silvisoli]|uniref:Bacterial Ig domain-containing protein n=1 Tax=Streptomyces silvisoli TaxID=3034235 RepID=A0ABT5ZPK0_9ACTN|nr:hypothetical protein [Streptomyces silvisoli]MDF3291727.1 hypothetical protein [Streptomyces silvisoli]
MTPTKSHSARLAVVGALSAALLTGGAGGAIAASHPIHPAPYRAPAKPSISIRVSPTTVKAGQQVTVIGRAQGLKPGSRVQLQHRSNGKWTSLHASTAVQRGGAYKLTAKLNSKGKQVLRVYDGTTTSSPVTVTVH